MPRLNGTVAKKAIVAAMQILRGLLTQVLIPFVTAVMGG